MVVLPKIFLESIGATVNTLRGMPGLLAELLYSFYAGESSLLMISLIDPILFHYGSTAHCWALVALSIS
jgi:hypothetical protein